MPHGSTPPTAAPARAVPHRPFLHSNTSHLVLLVLTFGTLWFEWSFGSLMERDPVYLVLPIAAILGIGSLSHGRLGKITPFFPFLLATMLICGTPMAVSAGLGAGLLSALFAPRAPRRWKRILFGASRTAFAAWIAGWSFVLASGRPGLPIDGADMNGLLAAMAGYLLTFAMLTVLRRAPTRREGIFPVWRRLILRWAPGCLLGVAVAAAIGLMYDRFGPWWGLAGSAASIVLYYMVKFYVDYVIGARRRERELTDGYLSIIEAMASAIEAKERTPDHHLRRVQFISTELARLMGLPKRRIEVLRTASLLHDIGKLAVPSYILSKPGRLTRQEFDRVTVHPGVGAEILESMDLPYTLAEIVRSHHEKFDGSGYPDGLKGGDIPLAARILAVVDSYDALTSDRPYRRAVSKTQALRFLQDHQGTDYDPDVVELLLREIDNLEEEWAAMLRRGDGPAAPAFHWTEVGGDSRPDVTPLRPIRGARRALLDNISSSHSEIHHLYEIVDLLGRSLNLQEILTPFAARVRRLIPFEACAVYLLDRSRQLLVPNFTAGADIDLLVKMPIPMGERTSGFAAMNQRIVIRTKDSPETDGTRLGFDWPDLPERHQLRRIRSCLAAPLSNEEGEPLGVLSFYHSGETAYHEDHRRLLQVVSKHVAAAVGNSLQYAESQEHALTDPLTTLPNARYLFVSFEDELNRASNLRIPLTIVELDVDNFKDINDVYGHLAGDKILRGIAKAIRTQLRGCDSCVRYAGDEFIVILPGVGREDVDYVERRIASCIEAVTFTPRKGKEIGVKISLGAATFPEEGSNFETLIGIADARMYASKYRKKRESDPSHTAPVPRSKIPGKPRAG